MKWIPILLLLFSLPLMAAETGYRIVHPDGTVEYTDDATRGGEEIPLREAPTYESVPVPPSSSRPASVGETAEEGYRGITILSPQAEQVLWFDGSAVRVSVQVSPALAAGDRVVIEMNGRQVASGQGSSFSLEEVFRGSHTLRASIVDAQGNTLRVSEPVTFHMKRHSVNKP